MTVYRRSVIAVLIVLVTTLAAGLVAGGSVAPITTAHAQDGGQTPAEICASADIVEPESRSFSQAEDVLVDGVDYWAIFCTESGPITVDLFEAEAPITVNNFVFLAQQGYYNNTEFHRVLPGFMAQGGDPTATGSGGPGYQFEDETSNGLVFDQPGLLAMANAGANTNGSQFFITYDMPTWLDGNHTIFGHLESGYNSLELLTPRDPQQGPTYPGAALNTVVIIEDPATVSATPDGPPDIDHLHAMLEAGILGQLNAVFSLDEEQSGVFDADALIAQAADFPDVQALLSDYLPAHDFAGRSRLVLPLSECPSDPASLPIWLVGFGVDDYTTANAGEAVVLDDDRAQTFVDAGVWEAQSLAENTPARTYRRAMPDHACGESAVYHRVEIALGRYVLVVDLILDSNFINDTTDPTAEQYLFYVTEDLLLGTVGGTLNRGNMAVAEE